MIAMDLLHAQAQASGFDGAAVGNSSAHRPPSVTLSLWSEEPGSSLEGDQVQAISAGGFMVRNTFIDGPPCVAASPARKRSGSAPPEFFQRCFEREGTSSALYHRDTTKSVPKGSDPGAMSAFAEGMSMTDGQSSIGQVAYSAPLVRGPGYLGGRFPREEMFVLSASTMQSPEGGKGKRPGMRPAYSSANSTSPSLSDEVEVSDGETEASVDADNIELMAPLQVLIQRECRFLRLNDTVLYPLTSEKRRKPLMEGVSKNLRVFVHGLPGLKRSKWQHPLAWCVANLLLRLGCEAFVKRGELFAPLNGSLGGEIVRVDFAQARP